MKTIYQIVIKGIATNKIVMHNCENFNHYLEALNFYKKDGGFIIITTNQFYL